MNLLQSIQRRAKEWSPKECLRKNECGELMTRESGEKAKKSDLSRPTTCPSYDDRGRRDPRLPIPTLGLIHGPRLPRRLAASPPLRCNRWAMERGGGALQSWVQGEAPENYRYGVNKMNRTRLGRLGNKVNDKVEALDGVARADRAVSTYRLFV